MMGSNREIEWQRRRSEFNHGWLMNKFIVKLQAGINLIEGKFQDPDFEKSFVSDVLTQWYARHDQLKKLVASFIPEMSPRRLVQQNPAFSGLPQEEKQLLEAIAHELWLAREGVESLLADVLSKAKRAHLDYLELNRRLESMEVSGPELERLRPLHDLFQAWCENCRALSASISNLPRSISTA